MNWGFLGIIFSFFSFKGWDDIQQPIKDSIRRNAIKVLASFVFLVFFIIILIKVYEVPVYVTKIDLVTQNCVIDDSNKVDIRIFRNFDRLDKGSLMRDSVWKKYNKDSRRSGGIYVTGYFVPSYYMSSESVDRTNKINNHLNNILKKKKDSLIKDPQIFYLSIQTSMRQSIFPKKYGESDTICHFQDSEVTTKYFDGVDENEVTYHVHDYLRYERYNSTQNGYLKESYYITSKEDNKIPFYGSINTNSLGAPSMTRAAEDISKIVEVVYIGNLDKSKNKHAGAWAFTNSLTIDYEGPTEFSEHIYPTPDSITLSSIIYKDKKKIEIIGRKGLRYHAKFPDMENRQESRIFVLSGIVTGLCALLLKYLWRLMSDYYSIVKRKLENKPKVRRNINVILLIILAIVLIWMLISVLTISVDPYDMYNTLIE